MDFATIHSRVKVDGSSPQSGCPFWLIWLKNRGPWFTWWFNQLPGPSIFPKRTPMSPMLFQSSPVLTMGIVASSWCMTLESVLQNGCVAYGGALFSGQFEGTPKVTTFGVGGGSLGISSLRHTPHGHRFFLWFLAAPFF